MSAPLPAPPPERLNPLWELILMRSRSLTREPSVLFWTFIFPLLTSLALGVAFRNQQLQPIDVAVADGPGADAAVAQLNAEPGLHAVRVPLPEARERLRRGKAALVLVPGESPELVVDPSQPEGRSARLLVHEALERAAGRADKVSLRTAEVTEPGSRYIDFLIPGLLGMGMMMSGAWGIGWSIVDMRTGKLLKRLMATPMKRSHFLLSFMVSRSLLTVLEVLFFVFYARVLFGVRMFGSLLEFVAYALLGSLSFAGLAILIASRAQNTQTASGLMNLMTMPMMVVSGVFFSSSHFPEWTQPVIKALPLTAVLDGLRGIMLDGLSIAALGPQLVVMVAWGLLPFVIALRIFRWS
ncbi:MAG TPA: ABC transporter permease [Myxococcales bacterium]|jgi:ABC-type multidrug transport system permease subunit|nr:ABC transporter permease [Myxococcales bacterium]